MNRAIRKCIWLQKNVISALSSVQSVQGIRFRFEMFEIKFYA